MVLSAVTEIYSLSEHTLSYILFLVYKVYSNHILYFICDVKCIFIHRFAHDFLL